MDHINNILTWVNKIFNLWEKEGDPPEESIVRIAEEADLTTEQIKRIIENFNAKHFLVLFNKYPESAMEFPLLDAPKILEKLHCLAKIKEEEAELLPSEYNADEPDYTVAIEITRPVQEEMPTKEATLNSLLKIKSLLEKVKDMTKVAEDIKERNLRRNYHAVIQYFKCPWNQSFSCFKKEAERLYDDDTKVKKELINCILEGLTKHIKDAGLHRETALIDTHREPHVLLREILEFYLNKQAKSPMDALCVKLMQKQKELQENLQTPASDPCQKEAQFGIASFFGGAGLFRAAIEQALKKRVDETFLPHAKPVTELEKVIEKYRKAFVLKEVLKDDPILAKADPPLIESAFNTLVHLAPHAAKEPEIVRSFLRNAIGQMAITPFDAEQLLKLEKGFKELETPKGGN